MRLSPQAEASLPDSTDRRTGRRFKVEGEVTLSVAGMAGHEVSGQLLDYSRNGFRVVHAYRRLELGETVRFRHVLMHGRAKVVWNRITGNVVETGFLILPK